ncbi:UPF0235 protein C15orf40 [Plecturocebus cupreus]
MHLLLGCRSEKTPGPVHTLPRSPILRSDNTFLSPIRKKKTRSDTPSHQLRRVGHDTARPQLRSSPAPPPGALSRTKEARSCSEVRRLAPAGRKVSPSGQSGCAARWGRSCPLPAQVQRAVPAPRRTGMLRLYRGLRKVGAEPGSWGSARLRLAAEMPKKAGATTKASGGSRGSRGAGRRAPRLGAWEKRGPGGKSQSKEPERPLPPLGPVAVDPKGCVTIAIHAKPGSKQNAVTDLTAEAINVAIAAPPSEGEANAELCWYLSKVLELRKSDVVLNKGGKSREKVVKLLASTTPEEILEKLKKEAKKT